MYVQRNSGEIQNHKLKDQMENSMEPPACAWEANFQQGKLQTAFTSMLRSQNN